MSRNSLLEASDISKSRCCHLNFRMTSTNFLTALCRLCRFSRFPNSCHINIRFSMETEKNKMLSFLDVEILCQQGKFTTTVYQKPTFSGIYINFQWFLPSIHKFRMIYNLVYWCFCICSNWAQFHKKLTFLKGIFCKNGYPELFLKNGQGQLFLKVFK